MTVCENPKCVDPTNRGEGRPQKRQRFSDGPLVESPCNNCVDDRKLKRRKERGEEFDKGALLDASMDDKWFSGDHIKEKKADGRSRLLSARGGPVIPEARFKGRAWPLKLRLPLPSKDLLDAMEEETRGLPREAPPGPIAAAWLEMVREWIWQLRLHFRGTQRRVCGVWRELYAHWVLLLRVLPKKRRERVLKMIREGVDLPWGEEKPKNLRSPRTGGCPDNVNLEAASDKVWETLHEQLVEMAIRPWNCLNREDVEVLPLGMFPIFWTTKTGSSKIRIIIDLRRLNKYMNKVYCKAELPSVRKGRLRHEQDDWRISMDLHSSYFHPQYKKKTQKWLGFSVKDSELPDEAVQWLWRNCPECRWRGRWVFVYASFAMGASPSVADFQEIMSAMVDACKTSGVGQALGLDAEQWKGVVFIDDVDGATSGGPLVGLHNKSGFGHCMELGLMMTATMMWLGCDINFDKSVLLPRQDGVFLGVGHDTKNMRFFLSEKRCEKLRARVKALRQEAHVGGQVSAKNVAGVVGSLWSIEIVCHRAVAVMCREMIACLAEMLRDPELLQANAFNMRWLLKRAWRGSVTWSQEADQELKFWESVEWEILWAPMGYDTLLAGLGDSVKAADKDVWGPRVFFVAADTSNMATGGGSFIPVGDGHFDCLKFAHQMLRHDVREESSAEREMEGIAGTIVAMNPPRGSRLVVITDNLAVYLAFKRGSSHLVLRMIARRVFLYCVQRGWVLQPIWLSRTSQLVTFCDTGSRLVDHADYSAPAGLFWGANSEAIRLWGQGFSHDRFASNLQVQPTDCSWKLPFTSWHHQAFSSGEDALASCWQGNVNWVNAPFALIGKVYTLVRRQETVAAVVVPRCSKKWWAPFLKSGAEGVVLRWDLPGGDNRCQMVGKDAPEAPRMGLSVVFLDFRHKATAKPFTVSVTAESVWGAWLKDGRPSDSWRYFREDGSWEEGVPRRPVPYLPTL